MTTLVAKLSVDKSQTRTRTRILDIRMIQKDLSSVFHEQYSVKQGQSIEITCNTFVYLYSRDELSNVYYETEAAGVSMLNGLLALASTKTVKGVNMTPFQGFLMLPAGGTLTLNQVSDSADTLERYVEVLHD